MQTWWQQAWCQSPFCPGLLWPRHLSPSTALWNLSKVCGASWGSSGWLSPLHLPAFPHTFMSAHVLFPPCQPISLLTLGPGRCSAPARGLCEVFSGRRPLWLTHFPWCPLIVLGSILCQHSWSLSPWPGCLFSEAGASSSYLSWGTLKRGTQLVCTKYVRIKSESVVCQEGNLSNIDFQTSLLVHSESVFWFYSLGTKVFNA